MTNRTLHRTLGERLEKARKVNGWNQQEIAGRLGISRRSITRYEDDVTVPSLAVLIAWAKVCDVPFEWLVGEPPSETDTSPVTLRNPGQLDLFPLLIADFVSMPDLLAA